MFEHNEILRAYLVCSFLLKVHSMTENLTTNTLRCPTSSLQKHLTLNVWFLFCRLERKNSFVTKQCKEGALTKDIQEKFCFLDWVASWKIAKSNVSPKYLCTKPRNVLVCSCVGVKNTWFRNLYVKFPPVRRFPVAGLLHLRLKTYVIFDSTHARKWT